jgi:hypothetical protein
MAKRQDLRAQQAGPFSTVEMAALGRVVVEEKTAVRRGH